MKFKDFKKIFTNKTFLLVVLQGVSGSIPWNGIYFMVTWLEYVGFDPLTAGLVFAVVAVGAALGNLLGGVIGDWAAKKSPRKGKILVAQISVFSGIPLTYVIFLAIPMETASMLAYIIIGVVTGLLISWAGPINNAIFSEIFEPEIRSSVYSVDRLFEGSFAAVGTTLVGIVATLFGYQTPPIEVKIVDLPSAMRITNMVALANGMFYVAFIPWIICLILYTLVYFTYPKDHERMRNALANRNAADTGYAKIGTQPSK